MRILCLIFDYTDDTEEFVKLAVEPLITLTEDDITEVGIPAANYGYAMGRIEDVLNRKGLEHTKEEKEVRSGGRIVATKKIYTFEYGRTMEILRAMHAVVNRCHSSKGWDHNSRLLVVNRVSLGNLVENES